MTDSSLNLLEKFAQLRLLQRQVNAVFPIVHSQQQLLELFISATPSGTVRNKLCDANIHLLYALECLHNASSEIDKEVT